MIFDSGDKKRPMTCANGFSLIELLTVLAILAILAVIAIPAYGRFAIRAHRVDGQAALLRIATAQEKFYASNNHYATLPDMGYAEPLMSERKYYAVTTVVSADPAGNSSQTYVATATPIGVQAKDTCGNLTIDNRGVKTPLPSSAAVSVAGSCW